MNINYVEYTLIIDSLKAYLDDDNEDYYNEDIESLINKLESNEIEIDPLITELEYYK